MLVLELTFWGSVLLAVFSAVGYPLLLLLLGPFVRGSSERDEELRSVDLIVPVHDAEREIAAKLENCLALRYPPSLVHILVVSEGSTDRTVEIAGRYADAGVRCLEIPERVGKAAAQNAAMREGRAEIVVLTDVSAMLDPDALRHLVSNFGDASVGAVSSTDRVVVDDRAWSGDALYIRYDMFVRRLARRVGSLVGVTGACYALRRELAREDWDPAFATDFYVALRAAEDGLRAVEDERVVVRYQPTRSAGAEFERKVRTVTQGMWTLFGTAHLLNPLRYGLVSVQLSCQKLLRWMLPLFQATALVSSGVLAGAEVHTLYAVAFSLQAGFYALALLGLTLERAGASVPHPLQSAALLLLVSAALSMSWLNLLRGRKVVYWEPTARG